MPMYCYTSDDGDYIHDIFPMNRRPKTVTVEGKDFFRSGICIHSGTRSNDPWPQHSCAMGVGVGQVQSAERKAAEAGVPTKFDPGTGDAIFTSRKHRRDFCKVNGFFDRDAGYGDPTPD